MNSTDERQTRASAELAAYRDRGTQLRGRLMMSALVYALMALMVGAWRLMQLHDRHPIHYALTLSLPEGVAVLGPLGAVVLAVYASMINPATLGEDDDPGASASRRFRHSVCQAAALLAMFAGYATLFGGAPADVDLVGRICVLGIAILVCALAVDAATRVKDGGVSPEARTIEREEYENARANAIKAWQIELPAGVTPVRWALGRVAILTGLLTLPCLVLKVTRCIWTDDSWADWRWLALPLVGLVACLLGLIGTAIWAAALAQREFFLAGLLGAASLLVVGGGLLTIGSELLNLTHQSGWARAEAVVVVATILVASPILWALGTVRDASPHWWCPGKAVRVFVGLAICARPVEDSGGSTPTEKRDGRIKRLIRQVRSWLRHMSGRRDG